VNQKEWEKCYARGLAFFGRISANVSHEIKNHLAVINELGGLLQDLSVMAQKDGPLDPVRVENLAGNITSQVAQSDNVVKAFNYFSHSVDRITASVDLDELAQKMVIITRRLAAVKGVELTYDPEAKEHLSIITNPFLLEQLYHFCLEHLISENKSGLKISVQTARNGKNGKLLFFCSDSVARDIPEDDYLDLLKQQLKTRIEISPDRKKVILIIDQLSF
jgi:C4-dicarboxylate-specific signal transduction histidine kinase